MDDRTEFDGAALVSALDRQRQQRELGWPDLAVVLHDQSAELNAELGGNCMCSGALVRTVKRGTMSCQYALPLLRWLGRPPEDFLTGPDRAVGDRRLPTVGPEARLRFDLPRLHGELDTRRRERGLRWQGLADELRVTPSRLTNLRAARQADMGLTMRVTQWLERPAAAFMYAAGE